MYFFKIDVLPELNPLLQKYLLLQWFVAYPADIDIFEMWPLEREFPENNWENLRIYLDIPDFHYIQLEINSPVYLPLTTLMIYIISVFGIHNGMNMVTMS